jgi:hypothetical protein
MSLSMYQSTIPVFIHGLTNLAAILKKGAEHAEARKIDPAVLIQSRLAPDMFPLARQVQIASDVVKGGGARLAGVEVPSFADTETTFPELQERIAKTIAFLKTLTPAQIDGSEERTVTLKVGGEPLEFKGAAYLFQFVLPNLHFHTTVAYSILRHNGVGLGKADFLGKK